jgi:hypothetical protein
MAVATLFSHGKLGFQAIQNPQVNRKAMETSGDRPCLLDCVGKQAFRPAAPSGYNALTEIHTVLRIERFDRASTPPPSPHLSPTESSYVLP